MASISVCIVAVLETLVTTHAYPRPWPRLAHSLCCLPAAATLPCCSCCPLEHCVVMTVDNRFCADLCEDRRHADGRHWPREPAGRFQGGAGAGCDVRGAAAVRHIWRVAVNRRLCPHLCQLVQRGHTPDLSVHECSAGAGRHCRRHASVRVSLKHPQAAVTERCSHTSRSILIRFVALILIQVAAASVGRCGAGPIRGPHGAGGLHHGLVQI